MNCSFKRLNSRFLVGLLASLGAAVMAGCGSGGSGSGTGILGVSLTDAAACGFDEVNVTVVKVRVHQSSSATENEAGWTDITLNPARKINLLNLTNGVLSKLGETPLAEGHYTQLRLVLDPNTAVGLANSVVPTGGVETALVTPSAVQSGIKLINQFNVSAGQRVDLVLDFDACKSIVKRGNGTYALKPVIKVIPTVMNGINGFVGSANPALCNNLMVTAQQNGLIVQSTAPNAQTGEFFLARLAPGSYDVALTGDGCTTTVIAAVPVASETSVTAISGNTSSISLSVSATRSISGTAVLNPVSATEVAYVAAKQTFGTAPTVTVKFVAADDLSSPPGQYDLTPLPVGAPMFGTYSATLPISLTAQTALAGKYTVSASATGYQTQTISDVDISAANATGKNFTLVP